MSAAGDSSGAPHDAKDALHDMRQFSRTPWDPYVRAYMVSRESEKKEQQQENLWTANFDRVEMARAGRSEDGHANRPSTVWTRPGTVSAGGHHMHSRTRMRELINHLPNPAGTLTDFAEYERLQTALDDSHDSSQQSFGCDFLGARRIIDARMTRASTALGPVAEPKWLPFTLSREETNRLRFRPSPLTGRRVADFVVSASLDPSAPTGSEEEVRGPLSLLRRERRLQAALQGTSKSQVSDVDFSNDFASTSRLLDSLLPMYKATTLRGSAHI